jgi:hypothetical protein
MAVVKSSAVGFRNAAYNMFFKRNSTTWMFVIGMLWIEKSSSRVRRMPVHAGHNGTLQVHCLLLTRHGCRTGGAIAGEYALHKVFDQLWENANKGVR